MKRMTLIFLSLALAGPVLAENPRSIVGRWHFSGESCESPIVIGPKSLKSEDVDCRFASVTRKGNTVTWKGVCDDAEGSSNQTVIATQDEGRLTIRYVQGGNVLENLERCE
jgi:hypothetical protein